MLYVYLTSVNGRSYSSMSVSGLEVSIYIYIVAGVIYLRHLLTNMATSIRYKLKFSRYKKPNNFCISQPILIKNLAKLLRLQGS